MLFEKISDKRETLWNHAFAQTMRNTELPFDARLSPIPHMTFFIMGFKDILYDLQRSGTVDHMQEHVNEHCQEDNGHWKWFLNDLERIKTSERFMSQGNWQLFAEMWSDENWPIRETVYEAVHLGRLASTSRLRMLMLEVIEAIFSVYAESINVVVKQMGMWETFEFFGKVHYEAENDHSSGSWLDGGKRSLECGEAKMDAEERELGVQIIERLFGSFTTMFERWYGVQKAALEPVAV